MHENVDFIMGQKGKGAKGTLSSTECLVLPRYLQKLLPRGSMGRPCKLSRARHEVQQQSPLSFCITGPLSTSQKPSLSPFRGSNPRDPVKWEHVGKGKVNRVT